MASVDQKMISGPVVYMILSENLRTVQVFRVVDSGFVPQELVQITVQAGSGITGIWLYFFSLHKF